MLTKGKKQFFALSKQIAAYLSGELTEEKKQELEAWFKEDEKNRELFERICAKQTMLEKFHRYREDEPEKAFLQFVDRRRRLAWRKRVQTWSACAAVVMLCLGFLFLMQQKNSRDYEETMLAAQENSQVAGPEQNRPLLTLAGGERIAVLENKLAFEETREGQKVILGDSVLVSKQEFPIDGEEAYNELEVPAMCDFHFTLSDGTKVWMNAVSSLRYPARFAKDSRTVYASGEVYLEVAKDASRPFYVILDGMEIKVLGTCFNVRAYPDEKDKRITLAEGKVAARVGQDRYLLKPGHQLRLDNRGGKAAISPVNVDEVLAWKRGFYVFKKCRLTEVISTLQNWYNVQVVMTDESLVNMCYTGVVNKEEPIDVFLYRLEEVSGVKWVKEGNAVHIYK